METKENKRVEIAAAAQTLFAEYGYRSVSIEQIAQHAHIGKGTFYLYYKSKEDVLEELLREHLLQLHRMAKSIEAKGLPFLDEIHQIVYSALMYRVNQKLLYKLSLEARELQTPSAIRAGKWADRELEKYLQRRLERAMEEGILRPMNAQILAFLIQQVYRALAFQWEEEHEKLDEDQIAQGVTAFLKEGLLLEKGKLGCMPVNKKANVLSE